MLEGEPWGVEALAVVGVSWAVLDGANGRVPLWGWSVNRKRRRLESEYQQLVRERGEDRP